MDGLGPSPLVQGTTWETRYISGGRGPPPPIWGILWGGSLYPGESRAFEIGHYTLGCAVVCVSTDDNLLCNNTYRPESDMHTRLFALLIRAMYIWASMNIILRGSSEGPFNLEITT